MRVEKERVDNRNIVFFDGVCNFCNASVDIIFKRNKKRNLFYSSLQSEFAKSFLATHSVDFSNLDTMIYFSGGVFYFRSDAALQIAKRLNGGYRLFAAFLIVPRFIRDGIYNWVAKNRYRFFGKKETCRIPNEEEKSFFLM